MRVRTGYNTLSELEYIAGIGTWAPDHEGVQEMSREDMLRNYLRAFELRDDWGGIDYGVVYDAVTRELS